MKLLQRVALVTIALASVATASIAQTPAKLSDVRHAHPGIDDAIDAMASDDFGGTANRLSDIWHRKEVMKLTTGAAARGEAPASVIDNLHSTLLDMARDLSESVPAYATGHGDGDGHDDGGDGHTDGMMAAMAESLPLDETLVVDDQQALYILQVVNVYALRRTRDLYAHPFTYCQPCVGDGQPCNNFCFDVDPVVYDDIDRIIGIIRPTYRRIREDFGNPSGTPTPAALNGNNFSAAITTMCATPIRGVESIDD